MTVRPSWMPASGIAPDRALNPPEPEPVFFDPLDMEQLRVCVDKRLLKSVSKLLEMEHIGADMYSLNEIRDAMRDLHRDVRTIFEEDY